MGNLMAIVVLKRLKRKYKISWKWGKQTIKTFQRNELAIKFKSFIL